MNSTKLFLEKSSDKFWQSIVSISADTFPYLKLEYFASDITDRSPAQLKEWKISYTGLPDAAVNTAKSFLFYKDTIQQGDMLKLSTTVSPTNNVQMDSLLVRYEIKNSSGEILKNDLRYGKLLPDNELLIDFSHPTIDLRGEHQLLVELNPGHDQSELYNFNNYLLKAFFVETDKRNPLLEVTFDGIHILNGDIVSPKPVIHIALTDENEFLRLDDTTTYKLYLAFPDETLKRVPLNSPEISFYPATADGENKSYLEFNPTFLESGKYALIVQANDKTGNSAGALDYKIFFEVILESKLSNFLPYPNPFSSATRFVYTLTGSEAPPKFKMQIMTVSGRIVREINQDEFGPLKRGTHRSDFVWDGTDSFGDQLANGVYLYRITAMDSEGSSMELFESAADAYFKAGIGKVVLVR